MASRTHNIIIALLVTVLLLGVLWPISKEVRSQRASQDKSTLLIAKPSRYTASDYKVRDPLNYVSPAGIFYGEDLSGKFPTRIAHVMAHTNPDDSKPKHSVFNVTKREDVLRLLDEAWKRRGPPLQQGGRNGRDVYDIAMNRVIGTEGERTIRIIMESNEPNIVTAYPLGRDE